jgi:hypothetical protein
MMKNYMIIVLVILTLFATSCTKDKWEGKIYEDQGVTIVENKGPGLWGEEAKDKVQFMKDFSIGVEDGEDHLMFNRYLSIAVDSKLNIYSSLKKEAISRQLNSKEVSGAFQSCRMAGF